MTFSGYDPGDRNNWYQSPHLGLFLASPAASGGGISGGYYNSPYHSYGSSTCAFTQFSSPPNPYPPLQLNPSATIINGHMFPHQFPFVAQQPLTTTPHDPYIPTYHSPHPSPNLWVPLSISQSHSHEPSISSVYSQFVPTNTMTTQPISHSASPPPTCGQPHTIADPKPPPLHTKPFRGFRCRVVMGAKARVAKKSRNPDLLRDVGKYSRSKRYHGCGLWVIKARNGEVFPRHNANAAVAIMEELHQLLVGQKTPITEPTSRPLKFGSLPAPMVAASLTASGRTSSSTTAIAGGSIRISEPNFNLSPHEAILDLNDDISVVVVSGSSSEDNIAVGVTEKLVLNVDKNTAGGGTGMKFSGSHCSDVAKSILWKNNAQSHRFQHTNFGNGSSVGNLLLYCEVHTSMEVGNGFLDDNFGEENVSVEDSFEKMQKKSERVLVPPMRKVMHGAGRYIRWFQRAFGIYICNLFDTGQASRVLKLERDILDYLLHHFFDVSARKEDQNTNGYHDHSSSSQSIIANVPTEFQCPKSGQKLIHMALTPNYALKRLLHQCSRSWTITIIFIFFCISVEKAIADTMKLTSEFLVGCLDVIPAIKKYLNDKIEPWLAGIFCENGFLHDSDSKWAGIVTKKKLADLGANYNDHHYHLGYFIYVIPVTSKIDLAWKKKYMSQAYSLGQKLNIQQGSSYFGIVPVILKEVFSFSSEMHCFSLVPIIFNVGMVTTVQPFSRDWGFQVHQLWPPLMMMSCFSLPLSLLGNDYFKSTLLITAITGLDVVALHFLCQTKASCHPRSFIVDEFFDFLKSNSKLSFVRYTCDALLSSDNCVGFLTNMHKFFQHMVGHVHKDEFFMATCSSTSCPPFHALVKKLFLLSPVVAIHSLQPLLADILRDDAQLIFGIMMVVSMNELMFLRSKKQSLEIGYSDIDNGNYCSSMSCSLHLPDFMITWFFEFTSVAIDFGDLTLIPPKQFSVSMRSNEAPLLILLIVIMHSQAMECEISSNLLQSPNREALRVFSNMQNLYHQQSNSNSHVSVHLCAPLHAWQVTTDDNTAFGAALINIKDLNMMHSTLWYVPLLTCDIPHAVLWLGYLQVDYNLGCDLMTMDNESELVLYTGYQTPQICRSITYESRKSNNNISGKIFSVSLVSNSLNLYDRTTSLLWQFAISHNKDQNAFWATVVVEATKISRESCSLPEHCEPYLVCYFDGWCAILMVDCDIKPENVLPENGMQIVHWRSIGRQSCFYLQGDFVSFYIGASISIISEGYLEFGIHLRYANSYSTIMQCNPCSSFKISEFFRQAILYKNLLFLAAATHALFTHGKLMLTGYYSNSTFGHHTDTGVTIPCILQFSLPSHEDMASFKGAGLLGSQLVRWVMYWACMVYIYLGLIIVSGIGSGYHAYGSLGII